MKKAILIDIGSSTSKVYFFNKAKTPNLKLIFQRSIPFKEGFDPEGGIAENNKRELIELLLSIKEKNPGVAIKTYATAIFRKLIPPTKTRLIDEIFQETGVYLNIIPHELENFYLEMALVGKADINENVLLINIGGGSTELVVMYGKEAIERKNIEVGVGTILERYPKINQPYSGVSLDEVVDWITKKLPPLANRAKIAFYTGGELRYMQLAQYPLEQNSLFSDPDHPNIISLSAFIKKNKEIFTKVSLSELEQLMPENPKWMHGARACSALAQAICQRYGIQTIIPSNSNLINGVIRQEFRYVTISGSLRKHLEYILKIKEKLEKKGTVVLSPRFGKPKNPKEEFVVFYGEEGLSPLQLTRHYLDSIAKSDALIVCSPEGYVGASALIEIGYANALGKRIIFTEKPAEFMLNTLPREIGIL